MSIEENFYKKNIELQQKIQNELSNVREGKTNRNGEQLQTILNELKKAEKHKNLILSYPRMIVDSWDYTDALGMELVELAELYKKIK